MVSGARVVARVLSTRKVSCRLGRRTEDIGRATRSSRGSDGFSLPEICETRFGATRKPKQRYAKRKRWTAQWGTHTEPERERKTFYDRCSRHRLIVQHLFKTSAWSDVLAGSNVFLWHH